MKKILVCVVVLLFMSVAEAQTAEPKISGWLIGVETRGSGVATESDMKLNTMELDLTVGYAFSRRFALYVPFTETVGMFKKDKVKSYETAAQLGLGLGYSPVHTSHCQLEVIGRVGSTLGGAWQYMYYDGGIRFGLPNSLYIGVGIRYYSGYKGDFGNHCNFYGAVGFRFNRFKSR